MAHREADWSELTADAGDDESEPTLCLFCGTTTPQTDACWAHMAQTHAFDLAKLKRERKMDFYECMRVINFLRATAAGKNLTAAQIAAHVSNAASWADEKWLVPTVQGDALLFSLHDDADSDDDAPPTAAAAAGATAAAAGAAAAAAAGGAGDAKSAAALARENAELRERVAQLTAMVERMRAAYSQALGLDDGDITALPASGLAAAAADAQPYRPPAVDDSDDDEPLKSNAARPTSSGAAAAALSTTAAAASADLPPLEDAAPVPAAAAKPAAAAAAVADVKGVAAATATPAPAAAAKPAKLQQPASDSKLATQRQLSVVETRVKAIDADYFGAYSDLYIHEIMLRDKVRTEAYRDFMYQNKEMFKGKVVLDIGCGSGILSLFAVRAGAKKVIGMDNADIIERARDVLARNGVTSAQCELVRGKVEEIQHLPGGITEVDIIISEWMGYFLLFESMLPTVLYARDKWLKRAVPAPAAPAADAKDAKDAKASSVPAGTFAGGVYPNAATMYIAGMQTNEYQKTKIDWWKDVYGFDFTPLLTPADRMALQLTGGGGEGGKGSAGGMAGSGALASVEIVKGSQIMTSQCVIKTLDLMRVAEQQLEFSSPFSISISDPKSPMTAFCVWFDNGFDHALPGFAAAAVKPIVLDTSPHTTPTHWQQTVFYLSTPVVVPAAAQATAKAGEWKVDGVLDARRSVRNDREYTVTLRYALIPPATAGQSAAPLQHVQEYYIQ